MKHWQETSRILQSLARLVEAGRGAALATVVHIEGSAYRHPGAKMLVDDSGALTGTVSGGCLETDVREIALSVIRDGVPQLLHYDTSDDAAPWGLGLGCYGAVDIFVQRATAPEVQEMYRRVMPLLQKDAAFAISTIVRGPSGLGRSLVVETNGLPAVSTGDAELDRMIAAASRDALGAGLSQIQEFAHHEVFTDVQIPPPSLLIIGAGEDTRPLVDFASDVGFRVTVADHRPEYLAASYYRSGTRLVKVSADSISLELGPRTYAIVKTHSLEHDREWVKRLLASDVPYIGILGSRARIDDVLGELGAEENDRVFGPMGLDLGADGPEQIAISVVAELLAVVSGREPGHLRSRASAIHAG